MTTNAGVGSVAVRGRALGFWRCGLPGLAALALGLGVGLGVAGTAAAQNNRVIVDAQDTQVFAKLPATVRSPEGITADPMGNLYVGTNDGGGRNALLRLDTRGRITAQLDFGNVPLLGVEFNPKDMKIYVASAGGLIGMDSTIRRVPANFGPMTPIEDVAIVPNLPAPSPRAEMNPDSTLDMITFADEPSVPNGLVFRASDGALFFSDSFQAAILRIDDPTVMTNTCPTSSSCVKTVVQSGLLAAIGVPQFGANGVAFSADEKRLFVANTGDDRILVLDPMGGTAPMVFAQNINGPDGLRRGPMNTLVVTANQADQIVILDTMRGTTIAELGEFLGSSDDGSPVGLSTPASVVRVGDSLFITNLTTGRALPSTQAGNTAIPFTISRIDLPARLR